MSRRRQATGLVWGGVLTAALLAGAIGAVAVQSPDPVEAADGPPASGLQDDTVVVNAGASLKGVLLDLSANELIIIVGGERKNLPRSEVKDITRAAPKKLLDFIEKKFEAYARENAVAQWRSLADFCREQQAKNKQSLLPERRRALREVIKLDPADAVARSALGQALLDGQWLEEAQVEAKLKEGFVVVDGKLVKSTATVVKQPEPAVKAYKILTGKKLSDVERKKFEKERSKRLDSAEKFLAAKRKEYEGVPWDKRHQIRMPHFTVHCNSTYKVAQQYGALMEIIRDKLSEMLKSKVQRNFRSDVFIYSSQEEFMAQDELGKWGGRGLGGYYNPVSQKVVAFHGTFGFTGTTFGVLCHEGTHYYQGLVLKNFANVPIWLIEGLAVYFGDGSTFDPKTTKIEVGKIPRDRLAHIQEKMLFKRHTPIDKLVTMTRFQFSGSHYADSWALIYFLVNSGDGGKSLLTEYWGRGIQRELTKKDFKELAEKYFTSLEALQKQYEDYITKLQPPPAGEIQGDYFISDYFQFDVKLPGPEWQFFEDPDDKKLLIGMLLPGTSSEIRLYYENNLDWKKADAYFDEYRSMAEKRYTNVSHEKTKMGGLDAFKINYEDNMRGSVSLEVDIGPDGRPQLITHEKKDKRAADGPRDVTEYKLIQDDGVATIQCSARKGEGARQAAAYEAVKASFTLTLTRRW